MGDHDIPRRSAARSGRGAVADRRSVNGERFPRYVENVLLPTLPMNRTGILPFLPLRSWHHDLAAILSLAGSGARPACPQSLLGPTACFPGTRSLSETTFSFSRPSEGGAVDNAAGIGPEGCSFGNAGRAGKVGWLDLVLRAIGSKSG